MLIELQVSRSEASLTQQDRDALESIGTMVAFGYHAVISRRDCLKRLAQLSFLSERARAAFDSVRARFTQLAPLLDAGLKRIVVSDAITAPILGGVNWSVPLHLLSDPQLLAKPTLLAENSSDARFYVGLGLVGLSKSGLDGLSISLQPRGGGGSTTPNEVALLLQGGTRFFLCIADSDKQWSGDSVGIVANSCLATFGAVVGAGWHCAVVTNDVRSVENLLLVQWIEKTDFLHANVLKCGVLADIQASCAQELAPFANLKSVKHTCFYRSHTDHSLKAAFAPELALIEPVSPCGAACTGACMELGGFHGAVSGVASYLCERPGMAGRVDLTGSAQERLARLICEHGLAFRPIRS